jgi:hypothetical protein
LPQIGRDWLIAKQNLETGLINLLLQLIDFFVVCDGLCAKFIIPLKQSVDRAAKAVLG